MEPIKVIVGDAYLHDFEFSSAVNADWSASILDSNKDVIAGITVTATVIAPAQVRVTISAAHVQLLADVGYKPLLRLRDDILELTRVEWLIEVTK